MRAANLRYYSSKGRAIYSDFSTFARGKALASCNAIEFARDFAGCKEAQVCEYGVGDGNFARVFLDEVKRMDPRLYSRTRYSLLDVSGKMLSCAKKTLAPHQRICSFLEFDAASGAPLQEFDYCRINELLSDLPAEVYAQKRGEVLPAGGRGASDPSVPAFLRRVEEGRRIPFNFAAEKFLLSLCKLGKAGFRIDVFDYGFYSAGDIFRHPIGEWNRLILRKYASQITCDVNFIHLKAALSSCGIASRIERQKEYAERVLGMPLEISAGKGKLDYVPKKSGFEEDDGFYHLRIGR